MYMCSNLIGGTNNLTNKMTILNPCTKVISRNERKNVGETYKGITFTKLSSLEASVSFRIQLNNDVCL